MSLSDHSGGFEDDQVLVAEYALGLLEGGERATIARRLATEPVLAADFRFWRQRLASLDAEIVPEAPPASLLPRIERRLFGEPEARRVGFWQSLMVWRGLAVAGYALAAIAIGYAVLQPPRVDPKDFANQLVAALNAKDGELNLVALYNPNTGSLKLTTLGGAAAPNQDFELWAIKGSSAPESMGVIDTTHRMDVKLSPELLAGFGEGTTLAISLEPKGGSPTGSPTGKIVATGAAAPI